jgi:hypothetical protein
LRAKLLDLPKSVTMAMESTHDAVQRLRLESRALVASLKRSGAPSSLDFAGNGYLMRLTRLRDISVELRRIAAAGTTPDARREAATLALVVADAWQEFDKPLA